VAKKDLWLERAAAHDERDLPELFASLTKEGRPATERRLLSLCKWPRSEAVANEAGKLLRVFPFDVWALAGASCALGVALVHRATARAFDHTELPRFSADVERWRKPALEAARRFTARIASEPSPGAPAGSFAALPTTPKALHAAWMKLAVLRAPDTLPVLLEAFGRGAATDVTARATALLDFARDPRVADAIAELLEYPPVTMKPANPFFVVLGLALVAHGDKRHAPALKKLVEGIPQLAWLTQLLDTRRGRASVKADPIAAPKSAGLSDERSFVAWIAEAPDDLTRRRVYADWLSERGDPRGELMALQLAAPGGAPSPEVEKRIAALLGKHQNGWLKSFARCLFARSEPVFADGMLSEIRLDLTKFVPRPDDPLLVGLRKLMVFGRQDAGARKLLGSPLLSGLTDLDAPVSLLSALGPAARARLVALGVRIDRRADLELLAALELPALRRLRLDKGTIEGFGVDVRPEEVRALPLSVGLEELEVSPSVEPAVWLEALRGTSLRHILLRAPSNVRFQLSLEGEPKLRVVVEHELDAYAARTLLTRGLRPLPREVLARTRVELREPGVLDPETAHAIEALGIPVEVARD
jgi:uncharacterized protein (TIGR02996 family)